MDRAEDRLVFEGELENLREKLNKVFFKSIEYISEEEYKNLIDMSRKLDEVIVTYLSFVQTKH